MSSKSSLSQRILNIFPVPKYLDFDPFCIDLSDQNIRAMKFKINNNILKPQKYKEIKIQEKDLKISEFANPQYWDETKQNFLSSQIKQFSKEFKTSNAFVVIPESESYIFKIKIPKTAEFDINSFIKFNLEENVPISAEDAIFEYFILKTENKNADYLEAVVNVFPKKVIETYSNLFLKTDIMPISFESESVALSKASITLGDDEPYLNIRFLSNKTSFSIVERGIVQYDSSVEISIFDILKDVEGPISTELRTTLNKLLVFWFTNRDYNQEHKKIKTAILSGEGATDDRVQELIEKYLKIKVEVANPWQNCFSLEDFIPDMDKDLALKYITSIGCLINKK
ncbi:MAG TPA: hypothetical protein PJ997_01315 [Candidatus Paceibacterota bacterium]|nr:hypothetical protein [Candidatus Paceibacterota bacterium]HMP18960.1 hypothetical protein [Candidatus Paceibacterota bacterium]HMP85575.1 hypothetical protein [Candidatus Paceibacterota bacterium]